MSQHVLPVIGVVGGSVVVGGSIVVGNSMVVVASGAGSVGVTEVPKF